MRGTVAALPSPRPLVETMPAVYRQDAHTQQLCDAFDEILAPVLATLDSFSACLDPRTTPADMLDWLAGWIGLTFDGHESESRRRDLVAAGVRTMSMLGTVRGIREAVAAVFELEPEIDESGGSVGSTTAGTAPPGSPYPYLVVRLTVSDPGTLDERRLDAVVEAVKPAHVPHRIEVSVLGA
ncbi:phage tail protein [Rhodococcus rhodochrous]|uniref:phage tail protein n=1 Tax=Rhodococcus rhodochrous TaxID=1829 RepID=UPI001320B43E|nr:phage tail protein [Rhodococcus pyridinivorans]MXQ78918.1 phage tail protein [Rhodococcus rhodochrous]